MIPDYYVKVAAEAAVSGADIPADGQAVTHAEAPDESDTADDTDAADAADQTVLRQTLPLNAPLRQWADNVYSYETTYQQTLTFESLFTALGVNQSPGNVTAATPRSDTAANNLAIDIENKTISPKKKYDELELVDFTFKDGTSIAVQFTDTYYTPDIAKLCTGIKLLVNGKYYTADDAGTTLAVSDKTYYDLMIDFAETSQCQFADYQPLFYKLPQGFYLPDDFNDTNHTVDIDMGRYGSMKGNRVTYDAATNTIKLHWNQNDSTFEQFRQAGTAQFTLVLSGLLDLSGNALIFEQDKTITLTKENLHNASITKTPSYAQSNGTITYDIVVTSDGTTEDLMLTDVMGYALKHTDDMTLHYVHASDSYDPAAFQEPSVVSNADGRLVISIPAMSDGDKLHISYTCAIDLDKIARTRHATEEETGNTATIVGDNDPSDNVVKAHVSDIDFSSMAKTSLGKTPLKMEGSYYSVITWQAVTNEGTKVGLAGSDLTDTMVESAQISAYHGEGVTVKCYDADNNLKETRLLTWADLQIDPNSAKSWTYHIPDDDPRYKYVAEYQTRVFRDGLEEQTVVTNRVTGKCGEAEALELVDPLSGQGGGISVSKYATNILSDHVTWDITMTVEGEDYLNKEISLQEGTQNKTSRELPNVTIPAYTDERGVYHAGGIICEQLERLEIYGLQPQEAFRIYYTVDGVSTIYDSDNTDYCTRYDDGTAVVTGFAKPAVDYVTNKATFQMYFYKSGEKDAVSGKFVQANRGLNLPTDMPDPVPEGYQPKRTVNLKMTNYFPNEWVNSARDHAKATGSYTPGMYTHYTPNPNSSNTLKRLDFLINVNPGKLRLNDGKYMEVRDVYSDTLSVDYRSIRFTVDPPENASLIHYDYHDNTGSFVIPDETNVRITYTATVLTKSNELNTVENVSFSNKVSVLGYSTEVVDHTDVTVGSTGSAIDPELYLYKFRSNHMETGLNGAIFELMEDKMDAQGNVVYQSDGKTTVKVPVYSKKNNKPIVLPTENDPTLATPGYIHVKLSQTEYDMVLEYNKDYYLHEKKAPTGYTSSDIYYQFKIKKDGTVNYSNREYLNGDVLTVRNVPEYIDVDVSKQILGNVMLTDADKEAIHFKLEKRNADSGAWEVYNGYSDVKYTDFVAAPGSTDGTQINWPEGLAVRLDMYRYDKNTTQIIGSPVASVTLDGVADQNGEYTAGIATFYDLPRYQADGETEQIYAVKEATVFNGYQTPDVTVFYDNAANQSLSEVTVKNTKKATSVTVTKVWSPSVPDNAYATFRLFAYPDGQDPAKATMVRDLKVDGTGDNGWMAVFADLPTANDLDIPLHYIVKEISHTTGYEPEYSQQRSYALDGETVTNRPAKTDFSVTVKWENTMNNRWPAGQSVTLKLRRRNKDTQTPDDDFAMDFSIAGVSYSGINHYSPFEVENNNDNLILTVKSLQKYAADGSQWEYFISQDEYFTTTYANKNRADVTDSGQTTNQGLIVNRLPTHDLTFSKTVTGAFGSTIRQFNFTVKLSNGSVALAEPLTCVKQERDGTQDNLTVTFDANGEAVISLRHGESFTVKGIQSGATYSVTEESLTEEGYTVAVEGASEGKLDADTQVSFTNSRGGAVPTGLSLGITSSVAIVVAASAAILLILRKRRKARAQQVCL